MASLSEKDPLGCPLCSLLSFPDFSPLFEMLMQNMASLPKRMNLHTTFVIWFPGLEPQLPPSHSVSSFPSLLPGSLARYLLPAGNGLPGTSATPQPAGLSFPGPNLRVRVSSEGQLEYIHLWKKNPSGQSRRIRGQGDDLGWPLGSSLGGVRGVERFDGGTDRAPSITVSAHTQTRLGVSRWGERRWGRQRLSSSNFLPSLSLQLSAWVAGPWHVLETSVFLEKDTEMFAVEL